MKQESQYPNAYYRVSVKAVIKDNNSRVLLVKEHNGYRVLPGGGIDHGESVQDAIERELIEEIGKGIRIKNATNIGVKPFYTRTHKAWFMWLIFDVVLHDINSIKTSSSVEFVDIETLKESPHESERNLYSLLKTNEKLC